MKYSIRRVEPKELDRASVLALLAHANGYDLSDVESLAVTFAAFAGVELVAIGGSACYHGYWCLRLGVVARGHRGHGLQRALIRARLLWLKRRGAKHVNVWVDPANAYSMNNVIAEGFRFLKEPARSYHGKTHFKLRKRF